MNGLSLALIRCRTERVSSAKKRRYRSALPLLLSWLIAWTPAIAAPLLKNAESAARSGHRVHTPAAPERKGREYRGGGYAGNRISLNFQNIEVRAVLQLLADFTGFNLVASDTVTGNITLRLKNVPWDQALDIILKAKGLSMRRMDNVLMVAPTLEIVRQEEAELLADRKIATLAPLHSEFIQINYAKADKLTALLKSKENQLLSERGKVAFDERTNTLLVQDTRARLKDIRRIVRRLDVPVRQVMIESRVVVANNDFARDLGTRFGFSRWQENINTSHFNEIMGAVAGHIQGTAGVDQARNPALAGVSTIPPSAESTSFSARSDLICSSSSSPPCNGKGVGSSSPARA